MYVTYNFNNFTILTILLFNIIYRHLSKVTRVLKVHGHPPEDGVDKHRNMSG
jgi:hypothetical protein